MSCTAQFLMAKADTAKLNEMVRMGTAIEQKYGNFRTEVKGKNCPITMWKRS